MMIDTACLALLLATQIFILGILMCGLRDYIRLRRRVHIIYKQVARIVCDMDCDEVIDQLIASDTTYQQQDAPVVSSAGQSPPEQPAADLSPRKRERLAALAAGGQARQYLGRALTADQIDSMGDAETEKLYARYEARLGAVMTKTLGQAALQLYSGVAGMFLPIPSQNQPKLVADLEADPFVGHALSSATCELYHRYGMYLAPLTAALTTAKYCQFGETREQTIQEDTEHVGRDTAFGDTGDDGDAGESDHRC